MLTLPVPHDAQATGYLGAGTAEDDASSLTGMGGNLVQLTPESIKDLGSEQIYKVGCGGMLPTAKLVSKSERFPSQMLVQIYQMYVKELSVLLAEGPNGPEPGTESAQQLEVLVKDLVSACPRLGWLCFT